MTNGTETTKKPLLLKATANTVSKTRVDVEKIRVNNEKQMEKAQRHIEELKDADREIVYKNGNGGH